MNHIKKESKNITTIMDYDDITTFLDNALYDKENETELGYYSSFLESEEHIKDYIRQTQGTRRFYILRDKIRRLYEY